MGPCIIKFPIKNAQELQTKTWERTSVGQRKDKTYLKNGFVEVFSFPFGNTSDDVFVNLHNLFGEWFGQFLQQILFFSLQVIQVHAVHYLAGQEIEETWKKGNQIHNTITAFFQSFNK